MFDFRKLTAFFHREPSSYQRAMQSIALGRYDDAIERIDALLAGASTLAERAELFNKRGVALVNMERRDEARAAFSAALALLPAFAPALVNQGNLALEDGDLTAAVGLYESAIRSDDSYPLGHLNLGVAYRRLGRRADAVREFRRAHRLESTFFFRKRR